jgi:DNA-binding response OmpR family regulator
MTGPFDAESAEPSTDTGRATVLIVDDERELGELFASWLAADYDTRVATDGQAALEQLTEAVDAVLLDRRMPGFSGDEVLEEIRERGLNCRVAMVTAIEPTVDVVEMGFDDYVTKPVTGPEIRRTVASLVDVQRHDTLVQEYFQLASKLAALESSNAAAGLDAHDGYRALVERFEAVQRQARDRLDALFEEDGTATFRRLLADRGGHADGGQALADRAAADD